MSHTNKPTVPIPLLPRPIGDIDRRYVAQLVQTMQDISDILSSEQARRFTEISLTDLASTGSQLRVGDVFEDSGILKIVRAGDIFAGSLLGTTSLGSVTVSTP